MRSVLWDIDNTLIDNAGVSKEIYAAAFESLTGQRPGHRARTEGRTDPEIMGDLLRAHGAPDFLWPQVQSALVDAGARHRSALRERGHVMPGALDVMEALAGVSALVQTVVTGNIRPNAMVKLGAFGLLRRLDLDVGAYGSDHPDRSQLVALARAKTSAKYGRDKGGEASTIVIGDTPRDVQAAHAGGSRVLAVASGIHSQLELQSAGADYVMADLADVTAAVQFVLSVSPH